MRKKNTIRLNESELKNIVKESVKKVLNETSDNARKSYNTALDKAEKYGKRQRKYVSQDWDDEMDRIKEIQDYATKIRKELHFLYEYNPRLNVKYFERLMRNCDEIYYAFQENGPIADAIFNQVSNRWFHDRKRIGFRGDDYFDKPFNKPYKSRDVWEPVDDNEDYVEPEPWYEKYEFSDSE